MRVALVSCQWGFSPSALLTLGATEAFVVGPSSRFPGFHPRGASHPSQPGRPKSLDVSQCSGEVGAAPAPGENPSSVNVPLAWSRGSPVSASVCALALQC